MEIITTTESLESLCVDLAKDSYVTVDTEFMREQTFWPELCLIQLAGERREAIVDPLAENLNLKPFFKLLAKVNALLCKHAKRACCIQQRQIPVGRESEGGCDPVYVLDSHL